MVLDKLRNVDTQLPDSVVEEVNQENEFIQKTDSNNQTLNTTSRSIIFMSVFVLTLSIVMGILNTNNNLHNYLHVCSNNTKVLIQSGEVKPKYWVYGRGNNVDSETGLLKHVHKVLRRVGFDKDTNESDWTLLWSHDYPFRVLYPQLHRLKPHQRVNHFPGTGFITNKVDLAISKSKFIPRAFKLPQEKDVFLEYAKNNPDTAFLQKHNQHRGVILKNISDIDLNSGQSFVQEFVQKPFLVDGHKFDIGVYVVITSVDPLRAYWYKGDVLFRYCPAKYYPFDHNNLDKYVIGDDYLPTWEVPSLARPYTALGYSMKDAFDSYVMKQGNDPAVIWKQVEEAIADVLQMKEHHIVTALKNYPSEMNFFELMRWDLVIDSDLRVHLLEANMSPNLSSAHFPPNQLLYEQVLYGLMSIVGVAKYMQPQNVYQSDSTTANLMISADKNIVTWQQVCLSATCRDECAGACAVCRPCLNAKIKRHLLNTHYEQMHRGDYRRLYPRPMVQNTSAEWVTTEGLTPNNAFMSWWLQGKCNIDITWCT